MAGRVITFPNRSPHDGSTRRRARLCALWCRLLPRGRVRVCPLRRQHARRVLWGRIASLEEWKVYLRHVVEALDNYMPNVVCAACRQG
jgi:hypothetical protein